MEWLSNRFHAFGDRPALIWHQHHLTYSDVLARIQGWQNTFQELGISPGNCLSICGDYSPNTCTLLVALMLNGNIVVPLSSSIDATKRAKWFNIATVSGCFMFDRHDNWDFIPVLGDITHPLLEHLQTAKDPGLISVSYTHLTLPTTSRV